MDAGRSIAIVPYDAWSDYSTDSLADFWTHEMLLERTNCDIGFTGPHSAFSQYVNWLSEQSLYWCLVTQALNDWDTILVHCEEIEGSTATVPLPGKDELFGLRLNERCGTLAEALNMLSGSKRSLTRWCFAHHVQVPRGLALRCQNELPFFELRNYEVVRLSVCDDRLIGAEAENDIGTADQDVPPAPLIVNEDYQ